MRPNQDPCSFRMPHAPPRWILGVLPLFRPSSKLQIRLRVLYYLMGVYKGTVCVDVCIWKQHICVQNSLVLGRRPSRATPSATHALRRCCGAAACQSRRDRLDRLGRPSNSSGLRSHSLHPLFFSETHFFRGLASWLKQRGS